MGGKGQSNKEEQKAPEISIKLYGDMFNSDTRSIKCLFDLAGISINSRVIDTIDKIQGKTNEEISTVYMSFKE